MKSTYFLALEIINLNFKIHPCVIFGIPIRTNFAKTAFILGGHGQSSLSEAYPG